MTSTPGGPIGKRLLHQTVDDLAQQDPMKAWALIPRKSNDGWEDITYAILSAAVSRMAWWMEEHLGKPVRDSFPTVCYIGKPDLRYVVVEMAAAKAGYLALFSSHINSLPAHLNLLEKTDCHLLITSSGVTVADILQNRPIKTYAIIPELDDLLTSENVKHYPSPKTFEEAQNDPMIILHTSGTTGLPKPITYTHGVLAALDVQSAVEPFSPEEEKRRGWQRQRWSDAFAGKYAMPFAPFHGIMAVATMGFTVFGSSTYVFPVRQGLVHTSELMEAAKVCDTIWLNPGTLEEIAATPKWLEELSRFEHIIYTGAVLSAITGQKISENTRLLDIFGTTETGAALISGQTASEDFGAVLFDPELNGIDWRAQGVDSEGRRLYEMVLLKKPELAGMQSLFKVKNFAAKEEHSIGDLWIKHESKPHTWIYSGRMDDLISFSSGLKYHPLEAEAQIKNNPLVSEAVLFGNGHSQTILLVELSDTGLNKYENGEQREVEASVFGSVDELNKTVPNLARVAKTHVLFAPRSKPFPKTPKKSIARARTLDAFKNDIDECYAKHGDAGMDMMERVEKNNSEH